MAVRLLCAGALALLAMSACQEAGEPAPTVASVAAAPVVAPDAYVGVWAETPGQCGATAWRLTPEQVVARGGLSCDVAEVQVGYASWALSVSCLGAGERLPGRLTLVLLDPAEPDVLTVQAGQFAIAVEGFDRSTTLTRCNG